jgi:SAM-dependent methyltransferase
MGVYEESNPRPAPRSHLLPPESSTTDALILTTHTRGAETRIDVGWRQDTHIEPVGAIPAREPAPVLPVPTASVHQVFALDVLEAVLDEEAWIAAIADVLMPGGVAIFRVPLEGPAAWLDALNMYRYAQDISGAGRQLEETKLKGWHRHYRPRELRDMFTRFGLETVETAREGNPLIEVLQFGGLVWGGIVKRTNDVEDALRSWREAQEDHRRLVRLGPLSTRMTVTVRKQG